MSASSPAFWEWQRERGSALMLRLMRWIAVHLGRRVARCVLYPLTLYFTLTSATTRRVSRQYLARVLPHRPRLRDVLRHVFTFASTSLDRVFVLTNAHQFDVSMHGLEPALVAARRSGTLLFVAHFGSFEILRVGALTKHQLPLKIVLDGAIGQRFMAVLAQLNPAIASSIIDSSGRGLDHVLQIREAIAQGAAVGMMVDRTRIGERAVEVEFLGGRTQFPAGPWLLAAALRVPVIIAFGCWEGGERYELTFEVFADAIELPRERRDSALQACVQRYADRLAKAVYHSPYNWANFFDFWPR